MKPLKIEFCGEWYEADPSTEFAVGREGDLVIDENPYLHRHFLRIYPDFGMWWLANVGNLLAATITDGSGSVHAWLAPEARIPIVFETMHVLFTAGSTTYDFTIHSSEDYFNTSPSHGGIAGGTTIEPVPLTTSQRQLIVSLAEGVLTESIPGKGEIPSSALAAVRLGWTITAFNRKLDNVCDKLDKIGVPGLRGGKGNLATNRRSRLVEYAVATRLVSREDVALLPPKNR
jgi:hypothetical protein